VLQLCNDRKQVFIGRYTETHFRNFCTSLPIQAAKNIGSKKSVPSVTQIFTIYIPLAGNVGIFRGI
jgi:hypothetical protein